MVSSGGQDLDHELIAQAAVIGCLEGRFGLDHDLLVRGSGGLGASRE
jgi:hypothetical protein